MKRGSATKKSGTITYQLHVRNDLQGKSTKKNPTMAVSIVNSEVITTEQLAKDINRACSITEADVAAVLQALGQRIGDALLDGNRVEIDHIGTFSLALTCKNKRKEDHITSKDIEVSRIVFSPCAELQHTMRGAVIVSGGPRATSSSVMPSSRSAWQSSSLPTIASSAPSLSMCVNVAAMLRLLS